MEQTAILAFAIDILESQQLSYMLVGSIASSAYGEPRSTLDIDIVVQLAADSIKRLCAAFPSPEFYVSLVAAREAVERGGQFNVIHSASGNKIDFMIARKDAWGETQLARRVRKPILAGKSAFVAAPEDVILGKLWYYQDGGSDKHLRDIAAMIQVSGPEIDRAYIREWSEQLGFVEEWQAVLDRLGEH